MVLPVRELVTEKLPLARCDHLEVRAIAAALEIGDQRVGAVVRGVGALGGVEHVEIFEAGAVMHGLPRLGAAGLVRAVVHDGHARMDSIDEGARVGQIHAVMIHEIEIDGADEIVRADQRNFFGLGEVAEIEKAELAEADQDAGGACDSRRGSEFPLGLAGALRIGLGLMPGTAAMCSPSAVENDDATGREC